MTDPLEAPAGVEAPWYPGPHASVVDDPVHGLMPVAVWRTCSAGSGDWIGDDSPDLGGNWYCARHRANLFRDFDPQPRREMKEGERSQRASQSLVSFIHTERRGLNPEYVVLWREGEWVLIRLLWSPARPPVVANVGELYPRDGVTFSGSCGQEIR